ncbi:MAG: PhzF family phenazine biosynthesis protein [Candidatus Cloacimonadota bacterium]|nr:MAG: PhzF family phenazine biosynthesis protein [Candidatus Cloacimonadota bacterium]
MTYYVVDVFSDKPFIGNPVAVIMCDKNLSDNEMQHIALWVNLSETTFVTDFNRSDSQYKIRIFTPGGEMPFAGHPTLGTAIAVQRHFNFKGNYIKQDCSAGLITIRFEPENGSVHLIAPDPTLEKISTAEKDQLAKALGLNEQIEIAAKIDAGPIWVTALINSSETIENLQPNQDMVKLFSDQLKATGIVIGSVKSDGKTYKIRTFAPSIGVSEDPVCGSGNVALAYLRLQSGLTPENYSSIQGQEVSRDGKIQITYLSSGKIELGGKTNITISGEVCIDNFKL